MGILWDVNTTVTLDPNKKCVISHGWIKGAPPYVLFATTRTHVILRWESCGQTFPTVVAHGQASERKGHSMIHQRENKTVLASRDGWWEKTGGVREKKTYLQGQRMVSRILTIQTTQVRFVSSSSSS